MNIRKAEDLLTFWQEIYGNLDPKWQKVFVKDKLCTAIIRFPSDKIKVAIRRNKKLKDILKDLENQLIAREDFLDKYDKYRNSREKELGSKIENREREGGRWGRTF